MMVKKSVIHREELSFRLLRTALFLLPPVTAVSYTHLTLPTIA